MIKVSRILLASHDTIAIWKDREGVQVERLSHSSGTAQHNYMNDGFLDTHRGVSSYILYRVRRVSENTALSSVRKDFVERGQRICPFNGRPYFNTSTIALDELESAIQKDTTNLQGKPKR